MPGGATYGAAADFNRFSQCEIRWISVHELKRRLGGSDIAAFDVRDAHDFGAGTIPGAQHLPQGEIFLDVQRMKSRLLAAASFGNRGDVVLFANTGGVEGPGASRDLYVLNVLTLEEFGAVPVERILRLEGGLNAWKAAGFELAAPPAPKAAETLEALLAEAALSHVAELLGQHNLESLQQVLGSAGRASLLDLLKELGITLPDRQRLTNAVARAVRLAQAKVER